MKKYTGKSEFEAGIGGSGSGGAGSISSGGMGRASMASKANVRAKVDAKDAAAEARRQRRLEKLTEKRHANYDKLSKENSPEGIAFRKQMYDMDIDMSDFEFKKGGKVSSASKRADGCCVRGKTRA